MEESDPKSNEISNTEANKKTNEKSEEENKEESSKEFEEIKVITSNKRKVIYLTFDDGPSCKVTNNILDSLRNEGIIELLQKIKLLNYGFTN